ncbi:MAG TPA: crotonase/enoyl-CoA hydratase family protein [Ferrovibrio sp.]|uniref:crotonase/enoyl-CoA hydratase family protein n=1 Tax=Ferrovibrio sp. TaxID=1917215 RepID=UPI002B4ACAB9|nr:crotonase/enoyl-CoA hydratase family protein [Ferrovibrio sp.]HLT77838.1 crotonase/enoyl-CoA hydratase family protein [Ferrovibrio sp.]
MSYTTFDFSVADHVAQIVFNRPDKANAMILPFWQEMVDVFAEIEDRPEVRAVVISSTGKHFTGGLDLSAFAGIAGDMLQGDRGRVGEQFRRAVAEMQESFAVIDRCRVPVLAAIQGGCVGGGVDLISACDMRYCTADAWFCIQEINIGMTADVGTLQRLPHLMPSGLVRELAYSGRRMPAQEAFRAGLVNTVFDSQEAMLAAVLEIAQTIASKSPLAIHGTKEMLNYTRDHSVADALNYMQVWQAGMFLTRDLMEQMQANQEKRPAKFDDLLPAKKLVRRRR